MSEVTLASRRVRLPRWTCRAGPLSVMTHLDPKRSLIGSEFVCQYVKERRLGFQLYLPFR
jgi:hypothetical protein